MKITFLKWGAVSLALLVSATGATTLLAQDQSSSPSAATPAHEPEKNADPSVAQRKENQQDRIANGMKSGQLTPSGTAKLEKQQQGINKHVASDRKANGGALTAREKKQVNKEQNQASRNIYKKKHNAATQPNAKKP